VSASAPIPNGKATKVPLIAAETMKAVVLHAANDLRIDDVKVPAIGPEDVLVRVRACGICTSDVHYLLHGRIGPFVVESPMILGHEASGDVVAVGDLVPKGFIGARVALEPGVACGRCQACKVGHYNLCAEVAFFATPPIDGAMAEFAVIRADFAHRIPETLSYEEATLVEPLSVGIHSARLIGVMPGDTVVVLGAGPIGLCAIAAAKQAGASRVIVSDMLKNRLAVAHELGASATVAADSGDLAEVVRDLTDGRGADRLLDTAGNAAAAERAPALMRRGGSIAIIGLPPDDRITYHMNDVTTRELSIHGVFRYANTYRAGIALVASHTYPLERIITDRLPLFDAAKGFAAADKAKDRTIKVVIAPASIDHGSADDH
jgi:L-iditol 2-dehydrogenase